MTILFAVICLLFLLACVQTARIAYTRKLPDMYWLSANFGLAALGNFFSSIVPLPIPSMILLVITSMCLVMFVQRTFYRDRKSPYLFILGLLLIIGIWQIYSTITNPTAYMSWSQLGFAIVWGWQSYLAIKTRSDIGSDLTVEDWVKARYLLWFAYTFPMFLLVIRMLLPIPYTAIESYITSPIVGLAVIIQYITWAMPEFIRLWLNRNYKPVAVANASDLMRMTEEELIHQIQAQ